MATPKKRWECKNKSCRNEKGKPRRYWKVSQGENEAPLCKHCNKPMTLGKYITRKMVNGEVKSRLSKTSNEGKEYASDLSKAKRTGTLAPGEERLISWTEAKQTLENYFQIVETTSREEYKTSKKPKKRAPSTIYGYRYYLNVIETKFGKRFLQEITKNEVENFVTKFCNDRGVGVHTYSQLLGTFKYLYKRICDTVDHEQYPKLYGKMIDICKIEKPELNDKNTNFIEEEADIKILLEECRSRHLYAFVYGCINTGLRHDDMLNVKVAEINFKRNMIITTTKGNVEVEIPLSKEYREYLEAYLKSQKVSAIKNYLIPSTKKPNRPFRNDSDIGFDSACSRAADRCEKLGRYDSAEAFRKLRPHHLRHTFASHFVNINLKTHGAGWVEKVCSEILGHGGLEITQRYIHRIKDKHQDALNTYGARFKGIKHTF